MTAISFDNVWKEYGNHVVLERISLTIQPRSFVALVGPSGCGKTTFLRMLLGQERPTRGQVLLDGVPLIAEPNVDRGVVFQKYSVFPHLSVIDNVVVGREFERSPRLGRLFGAARRNAKDEAQHLLDAVGLAGHESKYPAALSGGMQQRLALAQALICKPKVLLLDEPFGALDPGIRTDIQALMRDLWNTSDLTIVMVTHDLSEAFRLATRVIAFERPRDRPEERERYGATLTNDIPTMRSAAPLGPDDGSGDGPRNGPGSGRPPTKPSGASITHDLDVWPKKTAGDGSTSQACAHRTVSKAA